MAKDNRKKKKSCVPLDGYQAEQLARLIIAETERKVHYGTENRVGGKRSSFLPTFVFRPLTPPYVRFRIRRFLFWIPFEIRLH